MPKKLKVILDLPEDSIYCKSAVNGKMVRVTAIFTDIKESNIYLNDNKDQGVMCQADEFIFIANLEDFGVSNREVAPVVLTPFEHKCISCGATNLDKSEIASGLLCKSCETDFIKEHIDYGSNYEGFPDIGFNPCLGYNVNKKI